MKDNEESSDEDNKLIAKMLKMISKNIKDVKGELRTSNEKMENMSKKLNKLEICTKTNEDKTYRKYNEIQENLKNQIKENNASLEETISRNVIDTLKPKITAMHSHIVENDLRRIVQEQLQI